MPVPRKSTSLLGLQIAPKIKDFMKKNMEFHKANGATEEDGIGAIAEAIAYGIAIALEATTGESKMQAQRTGLFATVLGVPPGAPLGSLIDTHLKVIESTVKLNYKEV